MAVVLGIKSTIVNNNVRSRRVPVLSSDRQEEREVGASWRGVGFHFISQVEYYQGG